MTRHYRIPREVSSELKITKGIYLYDLLLIISLILIRFMTIGMVHSKLQIFYTILLIAFGIFLVIRPKSNPNKRMYQAIYFAFIRKKDTYCAIDYNPATPKQEGDEQE